MKTLYPGTALFILLLLCSFQSLRAHEPLIKGTVRDSASGEHLPGVIISLEGTKYFTSSDILGNFTFAELPVGSYRLKFSMLGYRLAFYNATVDGQNKLVITQNMSQASLDLSEIEIVQSSQQSNSSLISKYDISMRPVRSSQDILRSVPGLITAQHAGGGKAEQIFLRGFDIDHGTDIRLSVDGMPVNMVSHAHGQGYADLHFVIPELVENVNFNKGTYYADQGDFCTAGYADFKTRNSIDKNSLKLEGGRFNSYRGVGMFDLLDKAARAKNQSAFIATEYMYTRGYFESPQDFNRVNIFGKYHGMIGENKLLSISASAFSSRWEASGQVPDRAVRSGKISRFGSIDDKEGGNTSRYNINLIYTTVLKNNAMVKNQVFFSRYDFDLFSNFTFFLEDSVLGDQIRQREQRALYGYNVSYNKNLKLAGKKIISEIGLQTRMDDVKDIELSHTSQRKDLIERKALGQVNQLNAGVYLNESIYLTEKLVINAGARFDQFLFGYVNDLDSVYVRKTVAKNITSPKLSLYYTVNKMMQVYTKFGSGFHSNDSRVVTAAPNSNTLPRALGADLGIILKPVSRLYLNATLWTLDLEQEFVYVGDAAVVEPSGHSRRQGLDLSLRWQLAKNLFIDGDINYTRGKFMDNALEENRIPLAPTVSGVGGISLKLNGGFNASLRYRYVGDRPANEANTVTAKGYGLFDATINYTRDAYQFSLSAENLLNVEWNEAQFDTESRLPGEKNSVSELHYTPGSPFFIKGGVTFFF